MVDANDNAPSFAQSFYNATVLENSRGGVFVVSVHLAANCLVIHSNIAIIIRTYVHAFFKALSATTCISTYIRICSARCLYAC